MAPFWLAVVSSFRSVSIDVACSTDPVELVAVMVWCDKTDAVNADVPIPVVPTASTRITCRALQTSALLHVSPFGQSPFTLQAVVVVMLHAPDGQSRFVPQLLVVVVLHVPSECG